MSKKNELIDEAIQTLLQEAQNYINIPRQNYYSLSSIDVYICIQKLKEIETRNIKLRQKISTQVTGLETVLQEVNRLQEAGREDRKPKNESFAARMKKLRKNLN